MLLLFLLVHADAADASVLTAAGDSAGGNLVLTGVGLLSEQGRLTTLTQQPEALILLSPAVDMSNASVFARGEPVSSHIDADNENNTDNSPAAASTTAAVGSQKNSSGTMLKCFADLKQEIAQHHHQQQHLTKQQQRQHQVGGPAGPLQLLLGLAGELKEAWAVHRSKAGAAAAAAAGWFDYLPGTAVADNIHHYLHVRAMQGYIVVITRYGESREWQLLLLLPVAWLLRLSGTICQRSQGLDHTARCAS
jgi:hypothetical protein